MTIDVKRLREIVARERNADRDEAVALFGELVEALPELLRVYEAWEGASKIERGVMVMKDGKAWGIKYEDGHCRAEGWIDPASAPIRDPRYCTKPTDVTWRDSHYTQELATGSLVSVERRTLVRLVPEGEQS